MSDRNTYRRQNAERDAHRKKPFRQTLRSSLTNPNIITQALLVAFTFALALVGWLQWGTLEKSEETARVTQRPYVSAPELRIVKREPIYWMFQVMVENSGGTPTKDLRYVVVSSYNVAPTDPEDAFLHPKEPYLIFSGGFIAPKSKTALLPGESGLPQSVIDQMANDKSYFYIFGVIHYRDRFFGTPEHVTKFCFGALAIKGQDGRGTPGWDVCRHWNCVDEDCQNDKERYEAELKAWKRETNQQPK
jgi:hypothetical protein